MENSTHFTVTLDVETKHAVAIEILQRALTDWPTLLRTQQRLNIGLERAVNPPDTDSLWRFHVRDIDIRIVPPMPIHAAPTPSTVPPDSDK